MNKTCDCNNEKGMFCDSCRPFTPTNNVEEIAKNIIEKLSIPDEKFNHAWLRLALTSFADRITKQATEDTIAMVLREVLLKFQEEVAPLTKSTVNIPAWLHKTFSDLTLKLKEEKI